MQGLEPATGAEHAAALDLLAGGREQQFAAAATLIGQGDHALALEIIQPGLLRHPASATLLAEIGAISAVISRLPQLG